MLTVELRGCWSQANKHSRDALERARVEIERWRFALQKLLIRSNRYLKTKMTRYVLFDWAWPLFNSPFTKQKKCLYSLCYKRLCEHENRKTASGLRNALRFYKKMPFVPSQTNHELCTQLRSLNHSVLSPSWAVGLACSLPFLVAIYFDHMNYLTYTEKNRFYSVFTEQQRAYLS